MVEKLDAWILENTDPQDRSMDWFHNYKMTIPAPLTATRETLIKHLSDLYEVTEEWTRKGKQGRKYQIAEAGSILFARFNRKKAVDRYAEITTHLGKTFVLFWKGDKEKIIEAFSDSFRMHEEVPEKYKPALVLEKGELQSRWQVKQLPVITTIVQADDIGPKGKSKGWVIDIDQCGGTRSLDKALRTPFCSVSVKNRRDLIYYRQFGWPFWRIMCRSLSFGPDKVKIEYYGRRVDKLLSRLVISEDKAEDVLKVHTDKRVWDFPGSLIVDPEVRKVYESVQPVRKDEESGQERHQAE